MVAAHGGVTDVEADCGSQSGKSKLTVNLTGSVVTGSGTPPNAPGLFQAATARSDPTRGPTVEIPARSSGGAAQHPVGRDAVDGRRQRPLPRRARVAEPLDRCLHERSPGDPLRERLGRGRRDRGGLDADVRGRRALAGSAADEVSRREDRGPALARHHRQDGDLLLGFVARRLDDPDLRADERALAGEGQLHGVPLGRALGEPHRLQPLRRRRLQQHQDRLLALRQGDQGLERSRQRRRRRDHRVVHDVLADRKPVPGRQERAGDRHDGRRDALALRPRSRDGDRVEPRRRVDARRWRAPRRVDGGLVRGQHPGSSSPRRRTRGNGSISAMERSRR